MILKAAVEEKSWQQKLDKLETQRLNSVKIPFDVAQNTPKPNLTTNLSSSALILSCNVIYISRSGFMSENQQVLENVLREKFPNSLNV